MAAVVLNRVSVGSSMQLEPPSKPGTRYAVKIIGYLQDHSLVVTAPVVAGKVQIVREGVVFNVRMLSGGDIVGFPAKVLLSSMKPYPHLHLGFPKEVESINVRNAARIAVQLPAKIINLSETGGEKMIVNASLYDLSHTGAGLVTQFDPVAKVGDLVNISFQFELMAKQESLTVNADVRRVHMIHKGSKEQERYFHGVQFRSLERLQQLTLHAWTLERKMDRT